MKIKFIIPGEPQGKARPRVVRMKSGRSMSYTPDKTVAYEELVRQRFLAEAQGRRFADKKAGPGQCDEDRVRCLERHCV